MAPLSTGRGFGSFSDVSGDAPYGADIVGVSTESSGGVLRVTITTAAPLGSAQSARVEFDTKAGGATGSGTDYYVQTGTPTAARNCGLWKSLGGQGGFVYVEAAQCEYAGDSATLSVPAANVEAGAVIGLEATTQRLELDPARFLADDFAPDCRSVQWELASNTVVVCPAQPPPPPSPPPPPPPPPSPPAPLPGKSVAVEPASGVVTVRRAGTRAFVPLRAEEQLPVGSEVDAARGRVTLTSAATGGGTQTAEFRGGRFIVTQRKTTNLVTDLTLSGPLVPCPSCRAPSAQASADPTADKPRPRERHLSGDGHGSFRINGKYASAKAVGTAWEVQDFERATVVRVRRGTVEVTDRVKRKRASVSAPHTYVVKAPAKSQPGPRRAAPRRGEGVSPTLTRPSADSNRRPW